MADERMNKKRKVELEGGKVVGVVTTGVELSEKHTVVCRFPGFEDAIQSGSILTPSFSCHGHCWKLNISTNERDRDQHVSFNLRLLVFNRGTELKAKAGIRIGPKSREQELLQRGDIGSVKFRNFFRDDDILDRNNGYLLNGTLEVNVDIQVYKTVESSMVPPAAKSPNNTLHLDLLRMLESGENSDVAFQVEGKTFRAHRVLLKARAPQLSAFAEDCPRNQVIPIPDMDAEVFGAFLHFIYSDTLPITMEDKGRLLDLLEVANKYDCPSLKAVAEADIIASGITVENAVDLFIHAGVMDCNELKEATVQVLSENLEAVMQTESYSKIQESAEYQADLLRALASSRRNL